MDVFRKALVLVLVLLLCVGVGAMPAYAAQMSQDGLEVTLTADKDAYTQGEPITAALTVTNTTDTAIRNLRLEALVPLGYAPAAEQATLMLVDVLEAGESVVLITAFFPGQDPGSQSPGAGEEADTIPSDSVRPSTGDNRSLFVWIILVLAASAGLVILMAKNGKSGRRFLSLVLCAALLSTILAGVPMQTSAAESRAGVIGVETLIAVDDQTITLAAKVEYQPSDTGYNGAALALEADEIYFVVGDDATVTFTVFTDHLASNISLYCGEEPVAEMRDDGTSGDATAGDGVYSCILTGFAQTAGADTYHAMVGTISSNRVTLYCFEPLTEETAAQAQEVFTQVNLGLQNIEDAYEDEHGFVNSGEVAAIMDEITAYLAQRLQRGDIVRYELEDASAYIKFASGLTLVYEPTLEGVSASGSDVTLTFTSYQPHPDVESSAVGDLMDAIAQEYERNSESFTGSAVTLDRVKSIGSGQVIFWNGHGGYGPIVKSFLASGEDFDWNAWWWDVTGYFWDCVTDRIINRSTEDQEGLACFTSKFISHYCGDLSGDLLFLASCHSGQHDALANAFLDKGASAVVGFSDVVYSAYCLNVGVRTLAYMTWLNTDTGNYYTLSEALERAKDELGDDDVEYARQHPQTFTQVKDAAAKPVIFGNSSYRYRNSETGTMSGRICDAADRTTPIANATITVNWEGVASWSAASDSDGNYSLDIPAGIYLVTITAPGYKEFSAYATISANSNTYMENFLLIEDTDDASGTASGTITNAMTGTGIADVRLEVRSGWNNSDNGGVLTTVTTDAFGGYTLELPLGNYTLYAVKDGFIPTTINIVVLPGTTGSQNGSMTSVISGSSFRIVLTWGANPRDLDSHIIGKLTNGADFHVYYRHKSQYDESVEVCNLDVDDTSSFGPETITLTAVTDTPCYYYIHRYAGSGTVASSEAQVKVYQGEEMVSVFHVPTDQGTGDYWNVFAVVDGLLVARNTITAAPEFGYTSAAT